MMDFKSGVKVIRRVAYYEWSELLQDFVECPLDDADPWTLALANQINGRDLTDEEFKRTVLLLNGEVGRGVDI
jgi:hypothetical protein